MTRPTPEEKTAAARARALEKFAKARARWRPWHVVALSIYVLLMAGFVAMMRSIPQMDVKTVDVAPSLSKPVAVSGCIDAVTARLTQPRSADFRYFSDTTFHQDGTRSRVTVGFSANNGLGLTIDQTAACICEGGELQSAEILPSGA